MDIWMSYPSSYRGREVQYILSAVRAGDCASVIGLSGAGKSNLLGFIAHRLSGPDLPEFALVDCNRLASPTAQAFLALVASALAVEAAPAWPGVSEMESILQARLDQYQHGLCLLIDRFDALPPEELASLAGNLRSLRDAFKYSLTFVIAARRPLSPVSELAELFYAHTLWLGPLAPQDARWSAAQYMARLGLDWPEDRLEKLVDLSGGYPSLLRACCEAHAQGAALEVGSLSAHPAVRRRVDEFWRGLPSQEDLGRSGLTSHPLLGSPPSPAGLEAPSAIDTTHLTASEYALLAYFQEHPGEVCSKDALIEAVWPAEVYTDGLRDDSLSQLVRRLRLKIETDPSNPSRVLTVPGRGYRFSG
jgi:hypothetical protein